MKTKVLCNLKISLTNTDDLFSTSKTKQHKMRTIPICHYKTHPPPPLLELKCWRFPSVTQFSSCFKALTGSAHPRLVQAAPLCSDSNSASLGQMTFPAPDPNIPLSPRRSPYLSPVAFPSNSAFLLCFLTQQSTPPLTQIL